MKAGLERIYFPVGLYRVCHRYTPANRFTDSCKEILGLFRYWREGFKNNVSVFWTDPKGSGGVVWLQVKPRKVLVHENM